MDDWNYNVIISDAARDGKLYRLKVFLENHPREDSSDLVSVLTNGVTPLMLACKNGHLDVALYLIKSCNANVNDIGLVKLRYHKELVDVTALWCAVLSGHLNIVKMLIKYNASVNFTTKENSTVIYAACLFGRFDSVKCLIQHGADTEIATKAGNTCVMIACHKGHYDILKYLLESGADINKKNLKGQTALLICVNSGNLDILKMLLQNGANLDSDSAGHTPLLVAALSGHSNIIEFFMNEFSCTKEEIINSLELLGATFINEKQNMVAAVKYWKHAMEMRFEDGKSPLEKPNIRSPIAAFLDETEVCTFHELEKISSDPEKMMIQSLLLRERILGQRFLNNVKYIKDVAIAYAQNDNYDKCYLLVKYAFHVVEKYQEPCFSIIYDFLQIFTALFSIAVTENEFHARISPPVSFKDILYTFKRALKEIETLFVSTIQKDIDDTSPIHRTLVIIMHILCILCWLQPGLNTDEDTELKKAAYALVYLRAKGKNGWSPLHLACIQQVSQSAYPVLTYPSTKVVHLLLEVGACPNVVDSDNNTPLHIIAMQKPFEPAIFKALLNHGAHLDLCNYEKKTPLLLAGITPFLDFNPLCYISLKCLCAKIIQKYEITYEGFVHERLKKFLDSH